MSGSNYDTPPKNLRSLEQRLQNIETDAALRNRTRRQIGNVAVLAALRDGATDQNGDPLFAIKGGVAIELLMGLDARATKDLDASFRHGQKKELEFKLTDALAAGWNGFTFRLASWEPVRDTGSQRGDIKVSYRGRPFSTVQFEASLAEGESGRGLDFVSNTFLDPEDLGLNPVPDLPLVTLAYLIAQKLHACTDHTDADRPNDRARDLIDILLVERLVEDQDYQGIRNACAEIFRLRGKHGWPPRIEVLDDWPDIYADELRQAPDFEPTDVYEAAKQVDDFISRIDSAT